MTDSIFSPGDGFWNIRGSFKLFGFLDIGTQASLIRLSSGKFVLLDSYELSGDVEQQVMTITSGGADVEAVINTHPFHTVHCEATARQFPNAKMYGTERHHQKFPGISWAAERTETPEFHGLYAEDLRFTVPRGVDFIPSNQNLHFASVIVVHPASSSMHVDDTLGYFDLPLMRGVGFHPTLKQVLQKRSGAAGEFRDWVVEFIEMCGDVRHLCTAHGRKLPPPPKDGDSIQQQVRGAWNKARRTVSSHERRYG